MKVYILGNSIILKDLCFQLKDFCDLKIENNQYGKDLDVDKITTCDLIFEHHYVDCMILLEMPKTNKKLELLDGKASYDENIFKNHKNTIFFYIHKNDLFEYYQDKYDLIAINLTDISPFYITSKIALSEQILTNCIQENNKLCYQQKALILGYNDYANVLAETLSNNRMIVIVSDIHLQSLLDAKEEGYGILLKEEINNTPIQFDEVFIFDEFYFKYYKRKDKENIYFIDCNEALMDNKNAKIIYPFQLVFNKYSSLMAQNIASSFKKSLREYLKGE